MDGAGGVLLGNRLVIRRRVGDPRAGVSQISVDKLCAGTGTGSAGHDRMPTGHELHLRAAQDGCVPGCLEPLGPDTTTR